MTTWKRNDTALVCNSNAPSARTQPMLVTVRCVHLCREMWPLLLQDFSLSEFSARSLYQQDEHTTVPRIAYRLTTDAKRADAKTLLAQSIRTDRWLATGRVVKAQQPARVRWQRSTISSATLTFLWGFACAIPLIRLCGTNKWGIRRRGCDHHVAPTCA